MKYRGILSKPLVLHTAGEVIVMPTGSQIEVRSDDTWYHDVQPSDIEKAVTLMETQP
jgi:hypothetical protein